jgi:hypothetical protein
LPIGYTHSMIEVRQTEEFSRWVHRLRDANAIARIVARIRRMELGNLGDSKGLRGGVNCGSIMGLATASTTCGVVRRS